MSIRRSSIVVASRLLCVALLAPVARSEPPSSSLQPVTVAVVDHATGKPVTEVTYRASYLTPGYATPEGSDKWTGGASPDGTFEIMAPPSCRLIVRATAPDYVSDDSLNSSFLIKSGVQPRRIVVRIRRGITVRGIVRDARSLEPVAGAKVAPLIPDRPIWRPDTEKEVKTDNGGHFEVRGVDPELGVYAIHPDYIEEMPFPKKPVKANFDIRLRPTLTILIHVLDSRKKPLEGVTVDHYREKPATSDVNGRLVIRDLDRPEGFIFRKQGFIDKRIEMSIINEALREPGGLVVTMEDAFVLRGVVLAPGGAPINTFRVAAGPARLADVSDSVQRDVENPVGRFRLDLQNGGTTRVVVVADGFAAWEGRVDVQRALAPLVVRLSPGVTVTGQVVVPVAIRDQVEVRLIPRRDRSKIGGLSSDPLAESFPIRSAKLSPDGTSRFVHVRPDRYRLLIEGPGVPPTARVLDVPTAGCDFGSLRIDVPTGTGRVAGRVWHPEDRKPWAFAEGYIEAVRFRDIGDRGSRRIGFRADENGRFQVDHVPVGLTTLELPFLVSDDVMMLYSWSLWVAQDQTTEMRPFDPDESRGVALEFTIGDGSKSQYESGTGLGAARKVENVTVIPRALTEFDRKGASAKEPSFVVEFVPRSKHSFAFPDFGLKELDARRRLALPDVNPGRYQLRLSDWLGRPGLHSEPLFEREVEVPPGGRAALRIALGGGCITGKVLASRESFGQPVEVIAMAKGNNSRSRLAYCDDDGNFCVRYLSPGAYTLYIRDVQSGFLRMENLNVSASIFDVGEHMLAPGATIACNLRFNGLSLVPEALVAIGPSGERLRREFSPYSSFDRGEFTALWPGHWTVLAQCGDEILAKGEVDVEGTRTFPLTLEGRAR